MRESLDYVGHDTKLPTFLELFLLLLSGGVFAHGSWCLQLLHHPPHLASLHCSICNHLRGRRGREGGEERRRGKRGRGGGGEEREGGEGEEGGGRGGGRGGEEEQDKG